MLILIIVVLYDICRDSEGASAHHLRLECMNRKNGCNCRISMKVGVFTQTGEHNHDTQFREQQRAATVQECLNVIREPRMGRKGSKNTRTRRDARISLNPALERRIQGDKRANQPPVPTKVDELHSWETHPKFR